MTVEEVLDVVKFNALLVVVGTGGGDTLGKLTLCDWDISVPPLVPLPGPDDWEVLDNRCWLGFILAVDNVVSLDFDVSVCSGRGGTFGGISDVSLEVCEGRFSLLVMVSVSSDCSAT